MILLAGEITSRASVDYQKIVRDTIRHIGYDDSSKGWALSFLIIITKEALFTLPLWIASYPQPSCSWRWNVFLFCFFRVQALTIRHAMSSWLWSSSLLILPRVFTSTATRRTSAQGTRSVVAVEIQGWSSRVFVWSATVFCFKIQRVKGHLSTGFDVRLRHWRDGGVYASYHCSSTQTQCQDGRTASQRHPAVASARLQDPGIMYIIIIIIFAFN